MKKLLVLCFLWYNTAIAQDVPLPLRIQITKNPQNYTPKKTAILPQKTFVLNLTQLDNPYVQLN